MHICICSDILLLITYTIVFQPCVNDGEPMCMFVFQWCTLPMQEATRSISLGNGQRTRYSEVSLTASTHLETRMEK